MTVSEKLLSVLCVHLRLHLDGKAEEVDKSCGIRLVVNVVLAEGSKLLGVERVVALHARLDDVALVKLQTNGTGNVLLSLRNEGGESLSKRSEPLTVVNEVSEGDRELYKGNIIKAGVKSDFALYSEELATFGEDDVYNQADSAGFINLFGLPIKVQAQVNAKNAKK